MTAIKALFLQLVWEPEWITSLSKTLGLKMLNSDLEGTAFFGDLPVTVGVYYVLLCSIYTEDLHVK